MGMYCSVCGTPRHLTAYKDKHGDYIDFRCDAHLKKYDKPAQSDKVERNKTCSCGSGKKFKKCCGRKI